MEKMATTTKKKWGKYKSVNVSYTLRNLLKGFKVFQF